MIYYMSMRHVINSLVEEGTAHVIKVTVTLITWAVLFTVINMGMTLESVYVVYRHVYCMIWSPFILLIQ